ncbi:branched-chain amino acid ABC transporter permease [Halorarum halophilum]|uniref:Branched-chain amino acid ABC transporter permease n=1 Tax=Halorarum halophilum TaxID=2743090 RepID=A0A7D5KVA3_9EURY|nr:branched-chain amino acid ABC transporter permease [Halobaculum halophilum]QLG28620.1 branched-chain amino acid ABC transporter permease [Halobaculum halophilum]
MADEVGTSTEQGFGDEGLYERWLAIKDNELTVAVITIVAVAIFPWLFADAPFLGDFLQGYRGLASLILIWGIFAIGFDLLLGYTGLLSFGHAAFWGGGAYVAGIFSAEVSGLPLLVVLAGTVFAVLFAWVLGFLSLRRGGIYFSILTLAFAQMLYYMAAAPLSSFTNGENGFTSVNVEPLFGAIDLGAHVFWPASILLGEMLYVFIAAFFVLAVMGAYRILNSPYGIVLNAIRENEQRAEFVGLNVWRYKLMAFIISGAFAGVAGSLFTIHGNYVPLQSLYWTESGEIVIITVLGGAGSLFGPILGAGLYLYVANVVSGFGTIGTLWHLILGIIFVGVIWLFPRGIWGIVSDVRDLIGDRMGGDR